MNLEIFTLFTLLCITLLTGVVNAMCVEDIKVGIILGGAGAKCNSGSECCSKKCDFLGNKPSKSRSYQ